MLLFLFLFLVGFSLFVSYYFTNRISNQRKQIMLLKYENNNLKHKMTLEQQEQITVKYLSPNYDEGIIKKDCNLHLRPLEDSSILSFLNENTIVQIQDSAEVNKELWYKISILAQEQTNSIGWIKSDYLTFKDAFYAKNAP